MISIVVLTYNRSSALLAVLRGLTHQTDQDFEVVVADDGSTSEHVETLHASSDQWPFPLRHVWHPDVGFTASRARNLGVRHALGDYIVLLDGDCIPQTDFVANHRRLMQAGCFVNGSRVLLSRSLTIDVLAGVRWPPSESYLAWVSDRCMGRINRWSGRLRAPDGAWRCRTAFKWRGIRSCNLALWRSDYERVDGFDESFIGWGHEDADLVFRLHQVGLVRKEGRWATEVLHLWHPEESRERQTCNRQRVRDRISQRLALVECGYAFGATASDVRVTTLS